MRSFYTDLTYAEVKEQIASLKRQSDSDGDFDIYSDEGRALTNDIFSIANEISELEDLLTTFK